MQEITLSERTLQLLANFETINPSIVLTPGKMLRSINDSSTVIAVAQIEEDFPFEFPILDLTKLLAIQRLPSFKGGKAEFHQDYILLKGENSQLQFWRSAKELTVVPADTIELPSVDFEAIITPEKMKELTRACSTLGHKTVRLVAQGGKTRLVATTTTLDNSNNYTVELGETALPDFIMPLDVANLKMIEGNYTLRACAELQMVNFQSSDATINYFVGAQIE